jgi:hypothetical protein
MSSLPTEDPPYAPVLCSSDTTTRVPADNREIVTLLFGAGLLRGIACVCLFLPSLAALLVPRRLWPVVGDVSRDTVALVATSLLRLMAWASS